MSGASYATAIISFTGNLILARLLVPEDFGAFAFAVAALMLIFMISGFGSQEAIIQCRDHSIQQLIPTAFWMTIILGGLLAIGGTLLGIYLSISHSQIAGQLVVILSWSKLIDMMTHAYNATLQRELIFHPIAIAQFVSTLISFSLAVTAANFGFGIWSLLIKEVVHSSIVFGFVSRASTFKLRFQFNKQAAKWIWDFGWKVMVSRIGEIIFGHGDNLIIGRFLGINVLGHYSLSYRLAYVGKQFTETPIQAIVFSAYASVQNEKHNLKIAFEKTSHWLLRSSLLIALLVWFCGRELTLFLYGSKWELASLVFQSLFIFISLLPLQSNTKEFLIGSGNINRLLRVQFFQLLFFIPALFLAVFLGDLITVAWVLNGTAIITFLLMILQVHQITSIAWINLFAKPLLASSVASLTNLLVLPQFNELFPPLWYNLILQIAFVILVYILLLYFFERKTFHDELSRIRDFLTQ
jgi:teichuronic acid exporter